MKITALFLISDYTWQTYRQERGNRLMRAGRFKKFLVGCVAVGLASSALADVYKWRDDNGVLHYGDRPQGDNAEVVSIRSQRTDKTVVNERYAANQEARQNASEDYNSARSEAAAAEAAAKLSAGEKAEACTKARAQLSNYINARRLYKTDDKGEREYLDSKQIESARTSAEKNVADKCR